MRLFWMVIVQIVVLDAVFSLDSVITAVGMVKASKCHDAGNDYCCWYYALGIKPLMDFVNKHPTVVILCLGF